MGFKEEIQSELAKDDAASVAPEPEAAPDDTPVSVGENKLRIVKGDFAKAISPSLGNKPSIKEDVLYEIETEKKGYKPAKPLVLANPEDVKAIKARPKSMGEEIKAELETEANPLTIGVDEPKEGIAFLGLNFLQGRTTSKAATSEDVQRKSSETVQAVATALSIDEHLIVKGISKAAGLKDKGDLSDYTYTNLLRDMRGDRPNVTYGDPRLGFPASVSSDGIINAMGTGLSLFAVPSTYVSFGSSAAAKVGLKTALTKEGQRLAVEIAKQAAEKEIAERSLKIGGELTLEAQNAIRQQARINTEQQVLKKFGEINSLNKEMEISEQVAALPDRIKSKGGIKYEIPFTGREVQDPIYAASKKIYDAAKVNFYGKEVLKGEEVVFEMGPLAKFTQWAGKRQDVQQVAKTGAAVKDEVGNLFFTDMGVDRNLVNYIRRNGDQAEKLLEDVGSKKYSKAQVETAFMAAKWEEANAQAILAQRTIQKSVQKSFSYLDKTQQEEFMTTLIEASVESSKTGKKDGVYALSGDPKVQDAIDRWIGQGKHSGSKSIMEKLAEKSRIAEDQRLPIWVPGIIESVASERGLKIPHKLTQSDRAFLQARIDPSQAAKYTRDPVKAIGHRLTEISYANIQDKFFDNMVSKKLGGLRTEEELLKEFGTYEKAQSAGYVHLTRPYEGVLAGTKSLDARAAEPVYYVQRDFKNQYQKLVTHFNLKAASPTLHVAHQLLSWPTTKWKAMVTGIFPSFHAGNAGSNILLNAYSIGGHAISPTKLALAMESVLKKNWDVEARPFTEGLAKRTAGGAMYGAGIGATTEAIFSDDPDVMSAAAKGAGVGAGVGAMISDKTYRATVSLIFGKNMDRAFTTELGEQMTIKGLIREAERAGAVEKGLYMSDISGAMLNKPLSDVMGSTLTKYANPFSKDWVPGVFGQKFGKAVEAQARMVNYLHWRMKGLSPQMAAMEVNEALFDYQKITGFEKALNSTVIPFYTFSRKNLEAHYRILSHRPGAITTQLKFFRELGPTKDEATDMPANEWAQRRFMVKVNGEFYANFRLPIEDIMDLSEDPMWQGALRTNPMLRYAAEAKANYDVFSGRKVSRINSADEFKFMFNLMEAKKTPDWLRKSFEPVQKYLRLERDPSNPDHIIGDPNKLHALRSSFSSRFLGVMGQLSKEDQEPFQKALKFFTGVQQLPVDQERATMVKKEKVMDRAAEIIYKHNMARGHNITIWYGEGDDVKDANDLMKELKDAESVQEMDEIMEELEATAKASQKSRVGIDE